MKNALVLAPFTQIELARLRLAVRVTHESWLATGRLYDPEELGDRLAKERVAYLVIEADFVFEETMEKARELEMVALCRNAVNHVDLAAATERGVLVVNAPGRNAVAVAELTVALLLGLARRIPQAHQYIVSGRWQDPVEAYHTFRGTELGGKTAGIIGLGAIGQMVAKRLQAFEMTMVAADPYLAPDRARSLGVELVPMERLLQEADYVLVHTPSISSTMGLVGREQLALMKPGAYLVNTAAPGVVNEEALVEALEQRRIGAPALDVFDGQPLPPSSKLLSLDNVLMTPHIGGATGETIERHSRMIADDILSLVEGKCPRNLVNPEAWELRRGVAR